VRQFAKLLAVPALTLGICTAAYSQGRTIEETLVVSDPTVAAPGKWKVGGAAEYWWVRQNYNLVDQNGNNVGSASLNFTQPGWNIFAAYGNLTVQATRRSGDGNFTADAGALHYSGPQKSTDEEYTLRWLFPNRAISPYVLAGYAKTKLDQTYDIATTSPFVWACNGTKHLDSKIDFKGPLLGGGAIVPFSEKLGMRADVRFHWNKVEQRRNGTANSCNNVENNALSTDFTMTGYWNIVGGLNAQLGFKYQFLNGGDDRIENWARLGLFGMLGYTFRF
jgi:hypothetical protein